MAARQQGQDRNPAWEPGGKAARLGIHGVTEPYRMDIVAVGPSLCRRRRLESRRSGLHHDEGEYRGRDEDRSQQYGDRTAVSESLHQFRSRDGLSDVPHAPMAEDGLTDGRPPLKEHRLCCPYGTSADRRGGGKTIWTVA